MVYLKTQKRLAAQILKCSPKKVKFEELERDAIKEAITKSDIKALIVKKSILKRRINLKSRVGARKIKDQKRKGRKSGQGRRKGKKTARLSKKQNWMNKIRAQRKLLKDLKQNNKIENNTYTDLYRKSKGGFFRSRRHIKLYLTENNMLK